MNIFLNSHVDVQAEVYVLDDKNKPPVYIGKEQLSRCSPLWFAPRKQGELGCIIVKVADLAGEKLRRIAGECARLAITQQVSCRLNLLNVTLNIAEAFTEGFLLGSYAFNKYKSSNKNPSCVINTASPERIQKIIDRVEAVNFTRDLVGEIPSKLYPKTFIDQIKTRFQNTNVSVSTYSGPELLALGFNATAAVGAGGKTPAAAILRYVTRPDLPLTVLVGKGVTYDMGGMNIKIGPDLSDARMDMGGAAAVCGAFDILRRGNHDLNLAGIILCAENLPSQNAIVPSEVIRFADGKTVQVTNTDAEGRLLLADGIIYAQTLGANRIIDIGTLTGNVASALGMNVAAVFGDDRICNDLCTTGDKNGDSLWRMPLVTDYDDELKSDYADLKDMSTSPLAGCMLTALFLKRFVTCKNWAHIDMANTVQAKKPYGYHNVGPTGYGARLLADYLTDTANIL